MVQFLLNARKNDVITSLNATYIFMESRQNLKSNEFFKLT